MLSLGEFVEVGTQLSFLVKLGPGDGVGYGSSSKSLCAWRSEALTTSAYAVVGGGWQGPDSLLG
jgi:hypothetical protein